MRIFGVICVLFLVVAGRPLQAQSNPQDNAHSCLRFAQAFYDWYVLKALKAKNVAPWHLALEYDGNPFGSILTRALKASDAEAKTDGDPVLDFDPILDSQDPGDHYVVRNVTRRDGHYWADVYGVWSRPVPDRGEKPQVVAELILKNGRWFFVNFHYPNSTNPDNENLLSILNYRYQAQ